jgi:4-azaleucine resistance transporter AzlC
LTTKRKEFLSGARNTIPLLLGAFPFGIIYGTLAITAGLSPQAAIAMSLFVFAGSAQFVAVGLIGLGTPTLVVILTTFVVNLRHMLYSATLLPHVNVLPQRWRLPLAFWLTDETFAVAVVRYAQDDASPFKHWFQLGSSIAMYLNWQFWCTIGIFLGSRIPDTSTWGLDVAMPITFIGMLIPFVKTKPIALAVLTAGAASLLSVGLPHRLGIFVSALLGVLAGLFAERFLQPQKRVHELA